MNQWCTSLIGGRHTEDCLTQHEAVSTTLCSCSASYFPSSFGSASFSISPDSIRGFAYIQIYIVKWGILQFAWSNIKKRGMLGASKVFICPFSASNKSVFHFTPFFFSSFMKQEIASVAEHRLGASLIFHRLICMGVWVCVCVCVCMCTCVLYSLEIPYPEEKVLLWWIHRLSSGYNFKKKNPKCKNIYFFIHNSMHEVLWC